MYRIGSLSDPNCADKTEDDTDGSSSPHGSLLTGWALEIALDGNLALISRSQPSGHRGVDARSSGRGRRMSGSTHDCPPDHHGRLGGTGSIAKVELDAKVLIVSDSVHAGTREDRSGAALADTLAGHGFRVLEQRTVPDGVAPVAAALHELVTGFHGLVATTGGTGFSPTDLTPEATRTVIEREAPGLAEAMRAASPLGRLSRGAAGAVGSCLVVNVPGSTRGAVESIESILDVVPHVLDLLGGGHPH